MENIHEQKRQERLRIALHEKRVRTWKRVGMWGGVIAFLIVIIWGLSKVGGGGVNGPIGTAEAVTERDWMRGSKEASVTLIEYSDLECPACGAAYPHVKNLEKELGKHFRIVYRHFPLKEMHPHAVFAARAAEAAGKQGKFWEFHDKLFDNQSAWSLKSNAEALILGYAEQMGLNMDQFKKDMGADDVRDKVAADETSGLRAGVNATPTFFLNGKALVFKNFDEVRAALIQAINAAPAGSASTTSTSTP